MKVVNPNNAKDVWLSSDSPSCEEQVNTMMNRLSAKRILSTASVMVLNGDTTAYEDAIKLAIEALSQPPVDQWIPCSEITVEQVVESMKVIKSYCSQYKNCAGCRFEDWCWYDREHLTPDDWLMPEPYKED